QIAQWGYIAFQVGMANAQAIYGALAQLPVLMLWIYISWVTTLLGAEVAYACQHVTTYFPARLMHHASMYAREWLAHALYLSLVRAFIEGSGTWSAVMFAQQHHIPLRLLNEILAPLQEAGLLVETATSPDHQTPMSPGVILPASPRGISCRRCGTMATRPSVASSPCTIPSPPVSWPSWKRRSSRPLAPTRSPNGSPG